MSTVAERKKWDIAKIQREHGLKCPECHCRHLPVWWTEPMGTRVRRVRICRNCGYRIVTWEEAVTTDNDAIPE